MKVLITAATALEIKPFTDWLQETGEATSAGNFTIKGQKGALEVAVLVTGIGMMYTGFSLGKYFALHRPDVAIQAGIAGCFRRDWALGTGVVVRREVLGDLGAEDRGEFADLFGIGLWQHDMSPFTHHYLINTWEQLPPALQALPQATGVSVNMVSGSAATINRLEQKYQPDIESMEGAAFHYACLMEHIPFLQLRTISNYVEVRDKSKWDIPLAVKNLNNLLRQTFAELPII